MDISWLLDSHKQLNERMDGKRLYREILHVARLINNGKYEHVENQLHHIISVRANLHTERELERYRYIFDDDEEFEPEAIVIREAESDCINTQLQNIMANVEAIIESNTTSGKPRYSKSDIALWLMITVADLPQKLDGYFERCFLEYDKSRTGT